MSVMWHRPRKSLLLGRMARAGNAAFTLIDAFPRDGVSPPAGRRFARFCAVFQESVKKIRCRSAVAGGSGQAGACQDSLHGALVLPLIEPGALDRPGPGHEPSLPRLATRTAFRSRVLRRRARGGSAAGALAGRLRRRRSPRRSSHAVARRARAALPASPQPSRRLA